MPRTKNDWGNIINPQPQNNWDEILASSPRPLGSSPPASAPPQRDWSAFEQGSKPTKDWSAFGGPTARSQPPQKLSSFASRFATNLGDVVLDLTQSTLDAGSALARGVGVVGGKALGPARGPLSTPAEIQQHEQQLANDAVQVQRDLARTAPGQAALRAEQGLSDIAEAGLSLTSRALGSGRLSEAIHRDKAQREAFLAEAEKGGDVEKFIGKTGARVFNNVIRSTAKMATGGLAGQAGIYSLVGGEVFDERMASAKARGLDGIDAVSDALDHATIETGLTFLMGRFSKSLGFDTLEESLSPAVRAAAERLAAKAVPASLRQKIGKELAGTGLEWSEENLIDLTRQGVELGNGERRTIDWKQAFEAGATGGASRLAVGGVKELADRLRKIPAQTMKETVAGAKAAETVANVVMARGNNPLATPADRAAFERIAAHQVQVEDAVGARGLNRALEFIDKATPETLAVLKPGLSQKQFAAVTGIKKTSQIFRQAFTDTLALYENIAKPPADTAPAAAGAPTVASAASGTLPATAEPSTQGTPVQAAQSPTRPAAAAKNWLRENFTSAGGRNAAIDQANDARLGAVARDLLTAEQLRSDFDRAVGEAYGGRSKLTPAQVRELDAALKGKPSSNVPAEVMAAIEPMRAHVDGLSRKLIASGVVDPDSELGLTIEANQGSYLTRTYRKYGEKNWTDRVRQDTALMDRARAWLASEYPNESADVTEWRLNALLDRDSAAASAPAGVPTTDQNFMSVLRERKALPDIVRELYGEYRDPWVNYTKSVAKMANLLAHKQFIADVRTAGMATGFLSDEKSSRPENYRRINAAQSPRLAELAGLYTDPLTAKALQDLFSPETHGRWYRALVKASGYAKWSQTVGNSKTHVRNFVGNVVFAMSNGDLFSSGWNDAARMTFDHLLNRGDDNARAYLRRLAELRLADSNVDVGDIRSMAAEMVDVDSAPREGVWDKLQGVAADTVAGLSKVYQAQDTFWKVLAFENKKSQFAKAYPDATFAEIEKMAAEDVRAHYPTYDKVPTAVRRIGQFPLIAPFVNFHAEVIRTLKNTLTTIARDSQSENPQLREMAKQRAVGLVSSLTLVPALAQISRAIVGFSDDEEDDLREFLPSWSQNSQILHLGKDGDGNYDGVDLSFLDARGIIAKPILGLLRSGDVGERVDRAATELVAPLGEDLLFGRVLSAWRNQTPDGRPVYNEQADLATKTRQLAWYMGQPLVPGTLQQLDRIRAGAAGEVSRGGKPYDPLLESAALFGLRVSSTDTKQAFNFHSMDSAVAMQRTEQGILQVASNRGTVTPGEIDAAYRSYNRQREKLIHQWHEMTMAAIRLGVPEAEVRQEVVTVAGKQDAAMILGGRYVPYLPSANTLETIATRPDGPARVQQMIQLYGEAIDQTSAVNR